MQTSDPERQWIGAWHVPLNIAAMHLSGVLLCIGLVSIPAVSTATYGGPDDVPALQVFGLMAWILMFHVAIQIPVGLFASRWAVRGQVFRASLVTLGLATSVTWTFYLCTDRDSSTWALWWQSWACLCVSLSSYVWLCTLRRSTVRRLTERFKRPLQVLVMWALLRPPRRGPH